MLILLIFITSQKLLLLCMKQSNNISLEENEREGLVNRKQSNEIL